MHAHEHVRVCVSLCSAAHGGMRHGCSCVLLEGAGGECSLSCTDKSAHIIMHVLLSSTGTGCCGILSVQGSSA